MVGHHVAARGALTMRAHHVATVVILLGTPASIVALWYLVLDFLSR
jgi:hypothetical protein